MKKLLTFVLSMFCVAASAFAGEYTITFKDNGVGKGDNSLAFTTSKGINAIVEDGVGYLTGIKATNNVYMGKEGYGLKFSSSSKNGALELNLSTDGAKEITKVVVTACNFKSDEQGAVSINGADSQNLTDELADYTFDFTPTAASTTLKISATKRIYVTKLVVSYEGGEEATVAMPTITMGAKNTVEITGEEGAAIYYTLDGEDPTAESTLYEGAVTINADVTVKAIAVKDGATSGVRSFDAKVNYVTSYMDLIAMGTANRDVTVDAPVTVLYANGKYVFTKDETDSYMLLFNQSDIDLPELTNGTQLSSVEGGFTMFRDAIPEINLTAVGDASQGEAVEPTFMAVSAFADYGLQLINYYVTLSQVTIDTANGQLVQNGATVNYYDQFKTMTDLSDTEGKTYDVQGFVSYYDGNVQINPVLITEHVVVAPTPEYCTTGVATTSSNDQMQRALASFTLSDGTNTTKVDVNQATGLTATYFDKTDVEMTVEPGATLNFSELSWSGSWMHAYVYIDYDNDGVFDTDDNANGTTDGELVSYNFYSSYANATTGKNSLGESVAHGCGVTAANIPAFTLPANLAPGKYRLRFNIDWNTKSPCGSEIESAKGVMVDMTLNVEAAEVPVTKYVVSVADGIENGTVTLKNGEETVESGAEVEENTVLTVVATPAEGYELATVTVNNEALEATEGVYSFTVTEAATISATFAEVINNVSVEVVDNGATVTAPEGVDLNEVAEGTEVTLTITAPEGKQIESVTYGDETIAANEDGTYTITVAADKTLTVNVADVPVVETNHSVIVPAKDSSNKIYAFRFDDIVLGEHTAQTLDDTDQRSRNLTYSAWVKVLNAGPSSSAVMGNIQSDYTSSCGAFVVRYENGKLKLVGRDATTKSSFRDIKNEELVGEDEGTELNEWVFITVVADQDAQKVILYKNGKEISRYSTTYGVGLLGDAGCFFVGDYGQSVQFTEVQLWNKALTPEEVAASQELAFTEAPENLVAFYTADGAEEGATKLVNRGTYNGADGQLYSGIYRYANYAPYFSQPAVVALELSTEDRPHAEAPVAKYTLTIAEVENGTIKVMNGEEEVATGAELEENTELTVVATPAEGYELGEVTVNDEALEAVEGAYSFTLTGDATVGATFNKVIAKYAVTIAEVENGTLKVMNGEEEVATGAELEENTQLTVVATPAEGYELGAVTVNDEALEAVEGVYSFTLTADATVSATFTKAEDPAYEYTTPNGSTETNTYLTKIESTGATTNVVKEFTSNPGIYTLLDETIEATVGSTFNVNYVAYSLGDYSESTVRQDIRYTAAYFWADWNGDGNWTHIQNYGTVRPAHNVGGNYDYVMNINQEFTVPADVKPGTQSRIRVIYCSAWNIPGTNGNHESLGMDAADPNSQHIDKGISYDIVVNVAEAEAPVTTVSVEVVANGATVTAPEGVDLNEVAEGTEVTLTITAPEGKQIESVTYGDETIAANEDGTYTITVAAGKTLVVALANLPEPEGPKSVIVPAAASSKYSSFRFDDVALGAHVNGEQPSEANDHRSRNFTYSAWVKILNSTGNVMGNVQKPYTGSLGAFRVYHSNGKLNMQCRTAEGSIDAGYPGVDATESTDEGTALNEWVFISVVADQDAHTVTLYKNGKAISSSETQFGIGLLQDVAEFFVADGGANIQFSEVQLWNKVLTPDEIKDSYNLQFTETPENLVAYFKGSALGEDGVEFTNLGSCTDEVYAHVVSGSMAYQGSPYWAYVYQQSPVAPERSEENRVLGTAHITLVQPESEGNSFKVLNSNGAEISDETTLFEKLTVVPTLTEGTRMMGVNVKMGETTTTLPADAAIYAEDGMELSLRLNDFYQINATVEGATAMVAVGDAEAVAVPAEGLKVANGSKVVLTFAKDDENAYLKSFTVNGEAAELTDNAYTIESIDDDMTITAEFGTLHLYASVTGGAARVSINGSSLSDMPAEGLTVTPGASVLLYLSKTESRAYLKSFTVNGEDALASVSSNMYMINSFDKDYTINAEFALRTYTLSVVNPEPAGDETEDDVWFGEFHDNNNEALPSDNDGTVVVEEGTTVYFAVLPPESADTKYTVADVTDNGNSVLSLMFDNPNTGEKIYAMGPIGADHVLVVTQNFDGIVAVSTDAEGMFSYVDNKLVVAADSAEIEVVDVNGRLLAHAEATTLDVAHLVKGVYVAQAKANGKVYTLKFIKM